MSVFWWPTADWLVSGATTVTSPIGSRASFSASRPRDSMPSSLVTRIRGRVVQSPSGRPTRFSERGLPRVPATGSPRSLSRFRRSARARSRVISGRLAAVLGHTPGSGSAVVGSGWLGRLARRRRGDARRPRPRPHRRRERAPVGLRTCRPSRGATRWVARSATVPPSRDRREPVEEERGEHGRDRDPEDRADDPGDLAADHDRGQDDDRVDAHRARHQPRRDDVHRHEPREAHHDQDGERDHPA